MGDFFKKKEFKIGLLLLLIGGMLYVLLKIKLVLLPFGLGIVLAYLFNPFIIKMKSRNYSRQGALILLLIIILNVIVISGIFLFPVFINELNSLSNMVPKYVNSIENLVNKFNKEYRRIQLPKIVKESLDQFLQQVEQSLINFIQKLTETLLNSISLLFSLLLAPIISYYILKDLEVIQKSFLRLIPRKRKQLFYQIGEEINRIFVGYLRSMIWISFAVGVFSCLGLIFLKIKFYLILGILAGVTNMIPYIGPIIGALPAVLIALASSPLQALGVVLLYTIVQQVESAIIGPEIMSKNVGLHPLTIIFFLLAGAEILGIWGLLFAIPIAGSVKVLFKFLLPQLISLNQPEHK